MNFQINIYAANAVPSFRKRNLTRIADGIAFWSYVFASARARNFTRREIEFVANAY